MEFNRLLLTDLKIGKIKPNTENVKKEQGRHNEVLRFHFSKILDQSKILRKSLATILKQSFNPHISQALSSWPYKQICQVVPTNLQVLI